ncbi:hypothetical protein [Rhizobium mesoamericanum]|uniref:Uncharacterized protein n=1 Tax=Rhizobium mesoamericanum STM3625 TaxID=1211777 RepID=K0PID6_9HYPH|nr:hypothetical protein [Rhizobium mesoamericanum]CCM76266.1 hypothetical protein BN77_0057 [Rhizobium mesoamericanum STM3625]
MKDITIRVCFRDASGAITDGQQDFELTDFAGFLPAIGDQVLEPGVLQGLDRHKPENRTVWTVVGRVFNPKDLPNYVCLVVETRTGSEADAWI